MKIYLIKLKNILRSKYLFKILFIICIIYLCLFFKLNNNISIYNTYDNVFYGKVINYKYSDNMYNITLKSKENLIIYYKGNININYGDYIKVYGNITIPTNNTIFSLFNYKLYLKKRNINYIVNSYDIEIIKHNTNIIYDIKSILVSRINNLIKSKAYVYSLILNDKRYIDSNIKKSYVNNGISFLISLSSIYLSLYIRVLSKKLKYIIYNKYFRSCFILFLLIIYLLIVNESISIIRFFVYFILKEINNIFNLKIKRIDILLLSFIIISLINPYYIIDISFILSFLIIFFVGILNKNKNKLYTSFLCFMVTMPLVIYTNYSINILSIILTIIYLFYISYIVLPLSIVSIFFPFLDNILYFFINIINHISIFISNLNINIVFGRVSILFIIIYYILLTLYLYNKKYLILIITLLCLHKYYYLFDNTLNITYLDVGQGDSSVISYKSNTILIDTGISEKSDNIILYLKSLGKSKINYLILTHGDLDHMGGSFDLVNNFNVENVILNCGEFNDLESKLVNLLDKKKISYYSCINELNFNNIKLSFLNNRIYNDENNSSSVIYFNYNNHKFLFMGDAGVEVEKNLIEKYNLSNIDFLKVGHHGSRTSTSIEFIDSINPKYSIISVGKNNRYGHPNDSVLDVLEDSKIYRTDIDGSIKLNIKNNKLNIETCKP